MELKNKYVIGNLTMWYEVEMFSEYIDSCIQMLEGIENPKNVTFHFCISTDQTLEESEPEYYGTGDDEILFVDHLYDRISNEINRLKEFHPNIIIEESSNHYPKFYNIAAYRRNLNHNWCEQVDFVLWGETDSMWPKQTLEIIEAITAQEHYPKFVLNFAGRKNWDKTWDIITHPLFQNEQFQDNDDWTLNNNASEKSYMTLERMNEINNISFEEIELQIFDQPKADGSCLVISSDLIKSGVNIPHALIHCGEDESFLRMAKLVMGDDFVQYHIHNILRVHNRRHPRKRSYIKGENNPRGFCDERKGDWWKLLENNSKKNLDNLRNQVKFVKTKDVIDQIQKLNK